MGVISAVRDYLNPYGPAYPQTPQNALTTWGSWGPTGTTASGQNVTQDTALTFLAVYGSVSFIADQVSTLPLANYRDEEAGPRKIGLTPWMVRPNPEVDRVAFIVQCVTSLLLDGNLFIIPVRNRFMEVVELWAVDPGRVTVKRPPGGGSRVYLIDGKPYTGEMHHIPYIIRAGAERGLSPIEHARQVIGLGMAAVEHGAQFFGQGAAVSGVIQVPDELTDTSAQVMANAFQRAHSGNNKFLPGVLTGGATWQQTQITNEQAQFLESRNYTAAEIAGQLYHLDPSHLGIGVEGTSYTYANLEQRGIHLVQVTLLPLLVRMEALYTTFSARSQYVKFNVAGLMRADTLTRYQAHRIALGNDAPFATVDEVRELEERGPMPETGGPDESA